MKRLSLLAAVTLFAMLPLAVSRAQGVGGSPVIVAKQTFADNTGGLSETLFTPTDNGTFRVSLYVEVFDVDGNSAVFASLTWTDDGGAKPVPGVDPPLGADASASSYGQGVFVVHNLANDPISLHVNSPTLPAGASYTIKAVVEQI